MLVALPLRDDLPEPKGDEMWCLDENEILSRMNKSLYDVSITRDVVFSNFNQKLCSVFLFNTILTDWC